MIGVSGAGKSSLIEILAGQKLNGTARGTVQVNGRLFDSMRDQRMIG